jgi:hypothetical protein
MATNITDAFPAEATDMSRNNGKLGCSCADLHDPYLVEIEARCDCETFYHMRRKIMKEGAVINHAVHRESYYIGIEEWFDEVDFKVLAPRGVADNIATILDSYGCHLNASGQEAAPN